MSDVKSAAATDPVPEKPHKKRRWLRWLGGLVVLLLLLVLALPTIVSLGPVRSMVLGSVNGKLNGKLEVADLSVGWFSGTRVGGVKIFDKQGILVFEANKVETGASLLSLARGNYALGDTPVDINIAKLQIRPDGSNNLMEIFEPLMSKDTKPKPAAEIPNVSVNLKLNLRGTIEVLDKSGHATVVQLREGSGGTVAITDINSGVKPDLKLLYEVDNHPQSTVSVSGNIDAIENNKVDLDKLSADLRVLLAQVDLGAAQPFLAMAGQGELKVTGQAGGELAVVADGQKKQSVNGTINLTHLDVVHPAMQGDRLTADTGTIAIDAQRHDEAGVDRLTLKSDIKMPLSTISITGDVPVIALQNLSKKLAPGASGWLNVSKTLDLNRVAQQFPKTLHMRSDVTVQSGSLTNTVAVSIMPDKVVAKDAMSLTAIGTQDGKRITIEPININADASLNPTENPIRGLSDLALVVAGNFVNVNVSGQSLSKFTGNGNVDLDKARQQLSQFVDLSNLGLAGTMKFNFTSDGDLTSPGKAVQVSADAVTSNLNLTLPGKPALAVGTLTAGLKASLLTGSATPIEKITTASVTLNAMDDASSPLIDLYATADNADLGAQSVEKISVSKCNVNDLSQVQRKFEAFLPASLQVKQLHCTQGALYLVLTSSVNVKEKSADVQQLDVSMPNVTIVRDGRALLTKEDIKASLAGKVGAKGDATTLNLAKLSVTSSLLTLNKTAEPFTATLHGAAVEGSGKLEMSAQLVSLNRVAQAFTADGANASAADVRSGTFAGTLGLSTDADQGHHVTFKGAVKDLTLANGNETPVQNENFDIGLDVLTDANFTSTTGGAQLTGSYVKAKLSELKLSPKSPAMDIVQSATVTIGIPDMAKAQMIARSLVPGLGSLPQVTSGGAAIDAKITRDTASKQTNITANIAASTLAVAKGDKRYAFGDRKQPVKAQFQAIVRGDKSVDAIEVSQLSADLQAVSLTMPDKLVISNLSTKPVANGTIEIVGSLQKISPLLQVLQGSDSPLPFQGIVKIRPTVSTSGDTISLKIPGTIDDFVVLSKDNQPQVTEKQVTIGGDVQLNTTAKSIAMQNVAIEMTSSQAAKIVINGAIEDYSAARNLKNVAVNIDAVGEKVWPIIKPFMPEALQTDGAMYGPVVVRLTASGAAPVKPTIYEALATVQAKGLVKLDNASGMGLYLRNFELPLTLRNGDLFTADLDKTGADRFAKPAACNEGLLDLGSVRVKIGDPRLLTSIGRKQKILQRVRINEALAAQLGSVASFLFDDPKKADGLVDLTVVDCTDVPLTDLMGKKANASFLFDLEDMTLDGKVPSTLASVLEWGDEGIVGNIKNGSLVVKDGVAYQDMTINIQKVGQVLDPKTNKKVRQATNEQLTLKGGVNLAAKKFEHYQMWMSQGLLRSDWQKAFPSGATVSLKGSLTDVKGMLTDTLIQLGVQAGINKAIGGDAGNILDNILNQGKDKPKDEPKPRRRNP